jgi:hypothetical protein
MADQRKLYKWSFVVCSLYLSRTKLLFLPDRITILGVLKGEFNNCNAVLSIKLSSKKYINM